MKMAISYTWLLIGFIGFVLVAFAVLLAFGFFAKAAPETGANIFSQFIDAIFGRFG